MTIDDNVDFLNEAKVFFEDVANNPNINETIKTYFIIESLETAIKIIRKYQKLERVLDKIRTEIKALSPEPTAYDVVDGNPIKDAVWETIADVLKIINKYKLESEEQK